MILTDDIAAYVDQHAKTFTELSDAIWDNPQLRWTETDAVERQIAMAEKHGFRITRDVAGLPTAFSAEYGEGGAVIAFLGEYDSLAGLSQAAGVPVQTRDPANTTGNGQGCGHHLLGAGSLLAAVAVAEYLRAKGLPGRVRYYGCPAEEAAAGKTYMVKGGAYDDVDAAVTWHPMSGTMTRQALSLAYYQAYFHYSGVAAHAGASPHLGRSALDAVELCNVGTNFLREHMPDSARIHYAITDSGGVSPNVVQAQASVYYIVRATTAAEAKALYHRVLKVAEGAALMTETELTVEFDGACAEILPNDVLEGVLHRNTFHLGGVPFDEADQETGRAFLAALEPATVAAGRVFSGLDADDDKALHDAVLPLNTSVPRWQASASSDVGDVSWVTPTVQISAACVPFGTPFHSWQLVAQGKLPAAHKGMIHAAKAIGATAAELLTDTAVLEEAKAEFRRVTKRTPYHCPIPDDVVAPPLRADAS
ncbi:amidohydrolase [Streptomyces sp. NPDC102279]|uniref:amidohydrolase n=1 Tax=Streptomyces sp. NPDC102279 TaxID=3366153 RepID=UPI00381376CE